MPTTIARVRDNSVAEHMDEEIRAQLGVDLSSILKWLQLKSYYKILETPSAIDVEEFGQGAVRLMEFKLNNEFSSIRTATKRNSLS